MATGNPFRSNRTPAIRLDRLDLIRTDDGTFLLPVTMEGRPRKGASYCVTLTVDDAARLHAQLSRHLSHAWALTESEKASRQIGEIYPLGGDSRLA